jgi:hypothetical protein
VLLLIPLFSSVFLLGVSGLGMGGVEKVVGVFLPPHFFF